MKCERITDGIQIVLSISEACAVHNAIGNAKARSITHDVDVPLETLRQAIDGALRATTQSPTSGAGESQ